MNRQYPLFPLGMLLFPGGRLSLQVFEPRYMDLIKRCLRNDETFGVVGIREGSEVAKPGDDLPDLFSIGVAAKIVDWNGLEHGRIGVIVEGGERFKVVQTERQSDFLVTAEVEWMPTPEDIALPTGYAELAALLKQLALHPTVSQLGMVFDYTSANNVAFALSQLLPISNAEKFRLLRSEDALEALAKIRLLTDKMSGREP